MTCSDTSSVRSQSDEITITIGALQDFRSTPLFSGSVFYCASTLANRISIMMQQGGGDIMIG